MDGRKSFVISSFECILQNSLNLDMIADLKEWLIDHFCLALNESVRLTVPNALEALSAFTVCSSVKSIGILEYGFIVLLIPKKKCIMYLKYSNNFFSLQLENKIFDAHLEK